MLVGEQYQQLNNKKFDIRQWVLVKSFNPLKIYMYQKCYLRICSSTYDLKDIKQLSRHLTNFSLNKQNFQSSQLDESVCDQDTFELYLQRYKSISFASQVRPAIRNIIIQTLKSVSDVVEQKPQCFELYGFDILLDYKANPYLLEVNLSPACAERTQFLTEMLDKMAAGLLQLVLPPEYLPSNLPAQDSNAWELIYQEESDGQELTNQRGEVNLELEVIGFKADYRKEKRLDRKYFEYQYPI